MVESYENLDCTTVTHSGQVDLNQPLDSSRRHPGGNSFMQQAFSQLLYDGG
jgi:hypothetical protein